MALQVGGAGALLVVRVRRGGVVDGEVVVIVQQLRATLQRRRPGRRQRQQRAAWRRRWLGVRRVQHGQDGALVQRAAADGESWAHHRVLAPNHERAHMILEARVVHAVGEAAAHGAQAPASAVPAHAAGSQAARQPGSQAARQPGSQAAGQPGSRAAETAAATHGNSDEQ